MGHDAGKGSRYLDDLVNLPCSELRDPLWADSQQRGSVPDRQPSGHGSGPAARILGCAAMTLLDSLHAMVAPRQTPGRLDSYLLCATPRTGSSLLCGLLDGTGIAGHPESYFRQPDEHSWAARWGIARKADGTFSYADFVRVALAAGRTANGVFAVRIMWGTMDEITAKLAMVHPGPDRSGADLLQEAFGQTKFIYLRRDDVVAQAVSWLRAEQTNVWFETTKTARKLPEQEPCFDFDRIHELVNMIGEHNSAWQEWFKSAGSQPYPVL
jgi:LPS sulfotransferase NodH